MKILFVGSLTSSFYKFRLPLIEKLVAAGCEVSILSSDLCSSDVVFFQSIGVRAYEYRLSRSGLNPFSDIRTLYHLIKLVRFINPDVVFTFFVKPVILGTLAAFICRIPKRICMLEGLGFAFTEQPDRSRMKTLLIKLIQVFLYHISLRVATSVIFLNGDDRDDLIGRYRIKVREHHVIGGIGVNLNTFAYNAVPASEVTAFLFIGRLIKEKGIFEFLEAANIVKTRHPEATFSVIGAPDDTSPNPLPQKYLEMCIKSGLIQYGGEVDNVIEWISKCSVLVLPSYREGVPRSVQEAMAVGRAILTTDVPGCRDTVVNEVNGFLVPAFDAKALASRMIYCIENPDAVVTMGVASRLIAEDKFDVHKVNSKIVKVIGL